MHSIFARSVRGIGLGQRKTKRRYIAVKLIAAICWLTDKSTWVTRPLHLSRLVDVSSGRRESGMHFADVRYLTINVPLAESTRISIAETLMGQAVALSASYSLINYVLFRRAIRTLEKTSLLLIASAGAVLFMQTPHGTRGQFHPLVSRFLEVLSWHGRGVG